MSSGVSTLTLHCCFSETDGSFFPCFVVMLPILFGGITQPSRVIATTLVGSVGHVVATMGFAVAIASMGEAVMSESLYRMISSGLILALGVYFLLTTYVGNKHSCCDGKPSHTGSGDPLLPSHEGAVPENDVGEGHVHTDLMTEPSFMEGVSATLSLLALTSLSPCIASLPVLITIVGDASKIVVASLVLFATSAVLMCTLVALSYAGAARLDFPFIRRNERKIMGWSLVVLSVLTFFVFANHHHHHQHAPGATEAHAGHSSSIAGHH